MTPIMVFGLGSIGKMFSNPCKLNLTVARATFTSAEWRSGSRLDLGCQPVKDLSAEKRFRG